MAQHTVSTEDPHGSPDPKVVRRIRRTPCRLRPRSPAEPGRSPRGYHSPSDVRPHPPRSDDGSAVLRSPPLPRPAASAAGRPGERDDGGRPPRVAPVRPARGRRAQPRRAAPRPDRGLPPSLDRRDPLRGPAPLRDLQQGTQPRPDGRDAVVPGHLGPPPDRPRGRRVRRARSARRGAPGPDPGARRPQLHRPRAAGRDRVVLAPHEPDPGDPGGPRRGRYPRSRAGARATGGSTTWSSDSSRPTCWRGARPSATSAATSSSRATGPTASSAGAARPRSSSASARFGLRATIPARSPGRRCSRICSRRVHSPR